MQFCECGFKLYTRVEVDSASTFCLNCGKQEAVTSGCISKRLIKKDGVVTSLNAYTKFDPTLPRINRACENKDCSNESIIYIRINEKELKYCFLCPACDTRW